MELQTTVKTPSKSNFMFVNFTKAEECIISYDFIGFA